MIVYPVIFLTCKPLALLCEPCAKLLIYPFIGVVIFNVWWFWVGMSLKWDGLGIGYKGCVENGYLVSANTLTSWYYGITLPFVGLVCYLRI